MTIRLSPRNTLGHRSLPHGASQRLLGRRRPRHAFLCPQRRDRPLLATKTQRQKDILHTRKCGLPRWWRYAPQGKSNEDLPQLSQQSNHALQESCPFADAQGYGLATIFRPCCGFPNPRFQQKLGRLQGHYQGAPRLQQMETQLRHCPRRNTKQQNHTRRKPQ